MTNRSSWNRKYWDIADQFYWNPNYIGMKSIPQRLWEVESDRVSIPRERVNETGPLYARCRSTEPHKDWMLRQEEVLNHIFDLTFAIAPDALVNFCLARPLGVVGEGPYISMGREIRERYGWTKSENVTQHDGLFVSNELILGVELKLRSKSSPTQILKYAALLTWEEIYSGSRENLGLLFILENPADMNHWHQCGLEGPKVDASLLDRVDIQSLPKKLRELVRTHREAVSSALDRMILGAMTWNELQDACLTFSIDLDSRKPGDQTLIRLLDGFVAQVNEQVPSIKSVD